MNNGFVEQLKSCWSQFAAYFPQTENGIENYKRDPQPQAALLLDLYNMDIDIVSFLTNMNKIPNLRPEVQKFDRLFTASMKSNA